MIASARLLAIPELADQDFTEAVEDFHTRVFAPKVRALIAETGNGTGAVCAEGHELLEHAIHDQRQAHKANTTPSTTTDEAS